MAPNFGHEYNEKLGQDGTSDGSPTLTAAATVSDTAHDNEKQEDRGKHANYHAEQPPQLNITNDRAVPQDPRYLSPPGSNREHATRLADDLTLLQAEQAVSKRESIELSRSGSRARSAGEPNPDVFNEPTHQPTINLPPQHSNRVNLWFLSFKKLPRSFRYIIYNIPVSALLLIPILIGIYVPDARQKAVGGEGGVQLLWFGIWLMVVWLSLWAARVATSILPYVMRLAAKVIGSGNPKKWKDVGRQIELHAALFLWMLAVFISYHPILDNHKVPASGDDPYPYIKWIDVVYKIITALFILSALNFAEKILIQWIATTFHMRTYSTRIALNKQSIAYLVHLYEYTKDRLVSEASVMNGDGTGNTGSGSRTPMALLQENARGVVTRVGDIANRVAGDFTGREFRLSNHPRKVVTELLRDTNSAQVLGRRLFRTFADKGSDLLTPHDLRPAFPTDEDAEAAFGIFDRDLNGDVSVEEMEAFCDEVHREKKAIAASLKDLDSVIQKLDRVFFFIILIIAVIIFISIISPSAAAALGSLSTAVLGLSWMLAATAQEFLQSIIFVFVKHPFDVGDRVTIYGNTGTNMTGDDYYVTEISLLFTEFKKMEGHIVQAPNSVLNNLFILNHRRSGALADVFELKMKYGTPSSVIRELQARMEEWVLANKRDYTSKIITEVRSFEDAYRMTVNFICFHKTSFQNELLRLTRHNKFAIELMNQMVALGIEQPRRQYQISGRDFPVFQTNVQPPAYEEQNQHQYPSVDPSLLQATRRRAESTTVADTTDHFQDVFVARKTSNARVRQPPPRINEEDEEVAIGNRGHSTSLELNRLPSNSTHRSRQGSQHGHGHHIFGRPIGSSRSHDRGDRSDMV
ncbi:hypothetical protein DL765_001696 [Monosporascus sp. GIB2]|nr:hypothetical protein DL765_001696 [Monosporascus sp. GIB2]